MWVRSSAFGYCRGCSHFLVLMLCLCLCLCASENQPYVSAYAYSYVAGVLTRYAYGPVRTSLKAWFPYRCICRTKKIHRTDRIHSLSYNKLYLSFLLYGAFVREVSIKLYLSYEFFSYDRHDRYDDMETRLKRQ